MFFVIVSAEFTRCSTLQPDSVVVVHISEKVEEELSSEMNKKLKEKDEAAEQELRKKQEELNRQLEEKRQEFEVTTFCVFHRAKSLHTFAMEVPL